MRLTGISRFSKHGTCGSGVLSRDRGQPTLVVCQSVQELPVYVSRPPGDQNSTADGLCLGRCIVARVSNYLVNTHASRAVECCREEWQVGGWIVGRFESLVPTRSKVNKGIDMTAGINNQSILLERSHRLKPGCLLVLYPPYTSLRPDARRSTDVVSQGVRWMHLGCHAF